MVSMPKASFQVGCEVKFGTDLPNGPYGEMTGAMSGAIHVPPNSSYQSVKEAILKAWIESRGSMTNSMPMYSEKWDVKEIKYKGGAVDMTATASEGSHNVTLQIQQSAGCCIVL